MITSRQKRIQSELEASGDISPGTLAYFESRTMNEWYDFVVSKFLEEEAAGRLTRAELARRIKKSPAVITRLLSSPSNWTLATVSNLLLGISGEETVPQSRKVLGQPRSNEFPDWTRSGVSAQREHDPALLALGRRQEPEPDALRKALEAVS